MYRIFTTVLALAITISCAFTQSDTLSVSNSLISEPLAPTQEEVNKQIAREFYQDLWFTNNTDKYAKYVADEYVVHDIFERKGIVEPSIEQKKIADFFWENGDLKSTFDYQIAEGDLVATRWTVGYEPKTMLGNLLLGDKPFSIINVFRFKDGKIVEVWNHRHDIETGQTLRFTAKGFLIGLLIALIPTIIAFKLKRKLKRLQV